ncbi:hypothetical protein NEPTK9_001746 [Candidatus Neptunochlamydia vexilliferae]|uniref:Uncharacterized protein n=1 Tax=Candidatus Neptunichlamydia vexilliferae TaxID=1651774 RepID=A0ABS0B1E8_9BACT|nr:hypothetical protein [Candidatus Neptunochlamydia vexilliferae]
MSLSFISTLIDTAPEGLFANCSYVQKNILNLVSVFFFWALFTFTGKKFAHLSVVYVRKIRRGQAPAAPLSFNLASQTDLPRGAVQSTVPPLVQINFAEPS